MEKSTNVFAAYLWELVHRPSYVSAPSSSIGSWPPHSSSSSASSSGSPFGRPLGVDAGLLFFAFPRRPEWNSAPAEKAAADAALNILVSFVKTG